eukprot:1161055-Pelagomonas_calceolata.AAC.1
MEAAQRQHADLCKLINAKVVTLHTILLGVGGTCYTEHTLNQFKQLRRKKERSTLAVWPRALQKEPPNDSHQ